MSTSTALLRAADPAAGLDPDPAAPEARRLLAELTGAGRSPSRPPRRKALGRTVLAGFLAGAAALAVFVGIGRGDGAHLGTAAFSVSRGGDGTVSAVVRWSKLSNPQALQRELDRAGARTRILVVPAGTSVCVPRRTVGYSKDAVEWHPPTDADADSSFVVHPGKFPRRGTFVLVAEVAHQTGTGGSTFAPGFPQITGIATFMLIGSVPRPAC